MARYPIPAATVRTELRVKNSRFIATVGYADSIEAARTFIDAIRAEFPDATHHVYAYAIGYGASVTEGLTDDGEPSGTAGRPTLAVLRGADLGDVVLVTTRYFGGTKLGTGGLVRAYSDAAKIVLEALPLTELVERQRIRLTMPYTMYERARQMVTDADGQIEEETFAAEVTVAASLPIESLSPFEAEAAAGRLTLERIND
jgi:uncharacterized YigZ family protein